MGHPNANITFGIPAASGDGRYRSKYPSGDWPGDNANASAAGATALGQAALGEGSGQAAAQGAGPTASAHAPLVSGAVTGITFDSGFSGSGNFADGQIVTLNRSAGGLGTKPGGGKPLHWASLDTDLLFDSTYSRSAPSRTPSPGCTYQTSVKPANAIGCAKQSIAPLAENTAALFSNSPVWQFTTGKCYVYLKRYHAHSDSNGAGGPLNDKTIRLWPINGPNGIGPSAYYSIGSGLALCFIEGVNALDPQNASRFYSGMSFGSFDQNTFVACEHFFARSDPGQFNGIWSNARDGRLTHAFNAGWLTRDVGDADLASGYLDEFSNGNPGGDIYYHSFYVDDSLARVFVSDESSFSTATGPGTHLHREICIPISWSDTSVTFLLRKGSHTSLTGKYLYVATDANVVSRVGTLQ